uniref:Transthyretin-like family protein n=1 Tax=Bursaphelenchus xylophilus TaxID=6326 RepID=A0A1I7SHN2_BURXY
MLDPNDLVANVKTDHEGNFHITGRTDELTSIEPYLHFYYRCDSKECEHFSIRVEDKYIESGDIIRPFNFGNREVVNITGVFSHLSC